MKNTRLLLLKANRSAIYFAVLLASPVLIFLLNRSWTYQGFGDYDSFFYFGHFIHFPHYQRLQPTYAGERLPWVLPGYVLVHLFTPVYGTLALHFLAYYASVFSLYSIVRAFSSPAAGFLAACTLAFHPYFLAANGIDYVTGGCIAYCLVTFAFLVRSVSASRRKTLAVSVRSRSELGLRRLYISLLDGFYSSLPRGLSGGGGIPRRRFAGLARKTQTHHFFGDRVWGGRLNSNARIGNGALSDLRRWRASVPED